ncbi:transcriptional regulator, Crp/Fnr family [Thalassoporum mexicanum PCC 7367]|uniref:Crp/Fnr family transcriptional regulator n=1 Tax=Thalassoporum mexicanum TaxID=3457544 RepID=UPI00029FD08E|nr:Crp/Fnr family transcriptional regulator [Pseudanabaena sp. PCC 7367]AFY71099.1 transcriptional regulator, Crp/Fnr family [Pseudanabaena sp. PCC 7367]
MSNLLKFDRSTTDSAANSDWRQLLEEVYQGRSLSPYSNGQTIPLYPDEILVVCRGIVRLGTLHESGDEVLLGLAGPSTPFGLPLTLISPYQAIAFSHVDIMRLSMAEIENVPSLSHGLFRHLCRRLQQTEAMLALVSNRRVVDRLRQFLLLLKDEIGQPRANDTRLSIRLTHQNLATAIGTTRVTVTRALRQLQEEGMIKLDRRRHIVIMESAIAE